MSIDEIKNLNIKERLILIDTIWETLENQSENISSPNWHKEVLDDRMKKIKGTKPEFISLDELRKL